jgi:hypothetical protein
MFAGFSDIYIYAISDIIAPLFAETTLFNYISHIKFGNFVTPFKYLDLEKEV